MVLDKLYLGYLARVEIFGDEGVASGEHVHALHVELVDGLATVNNRTLAVDLHSRQLDQYVLQSQVLIPAEGFYVVGGGIVLLDYGRCCDAHFVKLNVLFPHADGHCALSCGDGGFGQGIA